MLTYHSLEKQLKIVLVSPMGHENTDTEHFTRDLQ